MAIDDYQVLLAEALETDEDHREPRWLLVLTLMFLVGATVLVVFYAQLPAFLAGFVQ